MSGQPNIPNSGIRDVASLRVVLRFSLRIAILIFFALAGRQGFAATLEGLAGLATFYCVIAATFRREAIFGLTLTHFDEAAAYGVIAGLARLFT